MVEPNFSLGLTELLILGATCLVPLAVIAAIVIIILATMRKSNAPPKGATCPACGAVLPPDAPTCPACGEPVAKA